MSEEITHRVQIDRAQPDEPASPNARRFPKVFGRTLDYRVLMLLLIFTSGLFWYWFVFGYTPPETTDDLGNVLGMLHQQRSEISRLSKELRDMQDVYANYKSRCNEWIRDSAYARIHYGDPDVDTNSTFALQRDIIARLCSSALAPLVKITVYMHKTGAWATNPALTGSIQCEAVGCYFTANPELLKSADAVLALADQDKVVYPESENHYVKVGASLASEAEHRYKDHDAWAHQFDVLLAYTRDSIIPFTYVDFNEKQARRAPLPTNQKRSDALIAMFVSNALAPDRYTSMKAIMPLVSTHSYGIAQNNADVAVNYPECMDTHDPAKQQKCVMRNYKFFWAYESSKHDDYVTENMYWALQLGVVPIYWGAANVADYVPPNSYINAEEFVRPADLADYLHKLNEDDELYEAYFAWKKKPFSAGFQRSIDLGINNAPCRICTKVYDMRKETVHAQHDHNF